MNAKEHYEKKYPLHTRLLKRWIIDLMESYYQAKSKEEAEDVVIKIIEAVSSEYRGAVESDEQYGLYEIIETIKLATFGKEGEG